jgi:hypothetical protein
MMLLVISSSSHSSTGRRQYHSRCLLPSWGNDLRLCPGPGLLLCHSGSIDELLLLDRSIPRCRDKERRGRGAREKRRGKGTRRIFASSFFTSPMLSVSRLVQKQSILILLGTETINIDSARHRGWGCSTQPYVCVDTEGQSRTRLNVLHADAAHMQIRHRGDQLAHN